MRYDATVGVRVVQPDFAGFGGASEARLIEMGRAS
jgi:hypothetical protein